MLGKRNVNNKYINDIQARDIFPNIHDVLEKYTGQKGDSTVEIDFIVDKNDIDLISEIKRNKRNFVSENAKYGNRVHNNLDFLDSWEIDRFSEGQGLSYTIKNNGFVNVSEPANSFLLFLKNLEYFLILARNKTDINLNPIFLYCSPYRIIGPQDTQTSLPSEKYDDLLSSYLSGTSKDIRSLTKVATSYFASKHRHYESDALNEPFKEKWEKDDEVQKFKEKMKILGYGLDLRSIDVDNNIYEFVLEKDGSIISLSHASSGEKEIINFILGIYAFSINGGLIIIDEPELHLHPTWQKLFGDVLIEVSKESNNQLIISTHSATFISPEILGNLRRVYRDSTGSSNVIKLKESSSQKDRELLHIVNSHNNEKMFFSDLVILVEGIQDRLIFDSLIILYRKFLNLSKVIEVLEVHGKHNFEKYKEFLNDFNINNFIISDQDYVHDIGGDRMKSLFKVDETKIDQKVILDKKSRDRKSLIELIQNYLDVGNKKCLEHMLDYLRQRHMKLRDDLNEAEKEALNNFIRDKKNENIFILKQGEIEDYLPDQYKSLDGTIKLIQDGNLLTHLKNNVDDDKTKELNEIVFSILGVSDEQKKQIDGAIKLGTLLETLQKVNLNKGATH